MYTVDARSPVDSYQGVPPASEDTASETSRIEKYALHIGMFLVAKHNKVCFYPFKPLADETNRTDTGRFNFSRATTEGREEFCFLFPLLS